MPLETKDGGYIIVGSTYSYGKENSDVYIVKIDKNGTEKWEKPIGGIDYDAATFALEDINQTLVLGNTYSFGEKNSSDIWLISLDSNGTELWSKTYGGEGYDGARCIRKTAGGGYIISGETESYGNGLLDIWILKIRSNGTEIWNKTFGGKKDDGASSIIQINSTQYMITGYTKTYGKGEGDIWILKISSNGTEIGTKHLAEKKMIAGFG